MPPLSGLPSTALYTTDPFLVPVTVFVDGSNDSRHTSPATAATESVNKMVFVRILLAITHRSITGFPPDVRNAIPYQLAAPFSPSNLPITMFPHAPNAPALAKP